MSEGITILYGSDTGTAQDYAIFLQRRLRYLQLNPTISTLDDYDLKKLVTDTKYLIIICATAGQGELPRNGKNFMKFLLKKKLPGDLLNHISLTSLGLGDSSYPKFNYAAKKLHTRLLQLGCQELSPRCEADEQSSEGLDGFYSEWERSLMTALENKLSNVANLDDSTVLPPDNRVVISSEQVDKSITANTEDISISKAQYPKSKSKVGSIKDNIRLTPDDHFQDVRHLTIETSDTLNYVPGDSIGLIPCNDPEDVEMLFELQPQWKAIADKPLTIDGEIPYIEGGLIDNLLLTLRTLFIHHLDLIAIPTRSFFFLLWHFVDDSNEDGQREKEKLQDFCNFENSEELYNYANRPRRLILETLIEFQNNLTIPVDYVFDLFPKIRPRLFLIASAPNPHSVELLIGIVEYKTIIRRIRKGLCTKWVKLLNRGQKVAFSVHKANLNFSLPEIDNPPLIMVGPGTGVAPMKALTEYCLRQSNGREIHLFYGFRNEEKDYFFKELWEFLANKLDINFHIYTAASRSQNAKKQYVQHKLFEQGEIVLNLILNHLAILYVCGSSGPMPRQVRETIVDSISQKGISKEDADLILKQMESSGRYIQETW